MAFTYSLRQSVADVVNNLNVTADGRDERDIVLASDATDIEVDLDFVYSRLKAFVVECEGNLTIETNANDATGGQTINVTGGVGFTWLYGSGFSNPISANVTRLFLTNASGASNAVKIRVLYDSTP